MAIPSAASDYQHEDDDDQKCPGIHAALLENPNHKVIGQHILKTPASLKQPEPPVGRLGCPGRCCGLWGAYAVLRCRSERDKEQTSAGEGIGGTRESHGTTLGRLCARID